MAGSGGPYGFRKLTMPQERGILAGFSCGEGHHADEVNGLVAELHRWGPKAVADNPAVVIMEDGSQLVGVGAYQERPLYPLLPSAADDAYVWAIGLSRHYRRMGLGRELLAGLMRHIREDWGHVPEMWAYVSTSNTESHPMFESAGFIFLPSFGGDTIRWRASVPLE
jgi:ribosomal protein S18 acetylase RimI-like enzyme